MAQKSDTLLIAAACLLTPGAVLFISGLLGWIIWGAYGGNATLVICYAVACIFGLFATGGGIACAILYRLPPRQQPINYPAP